MTGASAPAQMLSNSALPDWLPTELPAGLEYAGSQTCIQCHAEQASALETAMGGALQTAAESEFLRKPRTFENGPYRYEIAPAGEGVAYSVTDGERTITTPVLWSFGHGKAGQTYVIEHEDRLYESRVSYYLEIDGLDQTMGAPLGSVPRNMDEALGRRMTPDDVRGCFGCHATGVVRGGQVDLSRLTRGVQCEGCHGPGVAHLAAVKAAQFDDLAIESLRAAGAEQESQFCGACHRTWEDVALMDLQGPANVRFQPYRLANSSCYDTEDERIRCSACHDPHRDPTHEAKAYDDKCLACHQGPGEAAASRTAAACPTATEACSSCHMPQVEIPGSHFKFTDHQIRVVRPGEAYPN